MRLKIITKRMSKPKTRANCHQPCWYTGIIAFVANLLNIINTGVIIGKPKTAINAAFWLALAAMADKKVNTEDKAKLPKKVTATNNPI